MMAEAKANSGFGRKVRMSAIGKTALFFAATSSLMAAAQAPQTSAAQKPSPAVSASPAATGQQRVPVSPYGHRFVTPENLPHPNQPAAAAQPAAKPVIPQAVAKPPVQPRPVMPQPVQPQVPAPVAAQPPVQQPPVQQPPVQQSIVQPVIAAPSAASGAAVVDYSHGQLTVVSERATLGQVLKLVAVKTGGVVDVAPELQSEPVIARLGPGPVREVLTGLLDSPRVEYIIMAAGDGHSGLNRIVVRTRQSFGRTAMAAVPAQSQQQLPVPARIDEAPANGATPAEAKLTQEQLMENWKKTREQMRVAEIQQQARERESEQTHAEVDPPAEPQAEQPNGPPPPPDNPPQY